ncbi:hypothetical protein [Bartonella bacilliformis]|uniref:Uncharacterized protein n=2 Tax=Bartonella bacilliformis TaxID=774 RepID=A1URH2_BARBK|nr:hypothetical protein [Bartonella bacilliformis]ABM45306.1 hypothetical protein BARBAKC583_0242 [Bartonella bacilliformis KC583]EKS45875.1 hypothetical protein BbINS_01141 [Bartonella bacilliformis INS]
MINKPADLVKTEPLLSRWIVATDRFGQQQKCWGILLKPHYSLTERF